MRLFLGLVLCLAVVALGAGSKSAKAKKESKSETPKLIADAGDLLNQAERKVKREEDEAKREQLAKGTCAL